MEEIILSNDKIKMGIVPELGASLSFLTYKQGETERDILRRLEPSKKGYDSNNASMFLMLPFCGRIRGGSFVYWGITRKMQKNQSGITDPIHGDGWKAEWTLIDRTPTMVKLGMSHDKEKGGFPFSYDAEVVYQLTGDELSVAITVKNVGPLPMPCGLGVHPFFVKTKDVELNFETNVVWSNETDPIFDKPYATPETWQFSGSRPLKNAVFDTCFGGFTGTAKITYPETGLSVNITADEQYRHIVLYSPRGKDFFCLEPTTNASNAFNLASGGVIGTGMKSIGPGQTMTGTVSFQIKG